MDIIEDILLKNYIGALEEYNKYINYFKCKTLYYNYTYYDLDIFENSDKLIKENLYITLLILLEDLKRIKNEHIDSK